MKLSGKMPRVQIEEDILSQDISDGDVISIGGVDYMVSMTHKNNNDYTAPMDYAVRVYFVVNDPSVETVNFKDSYIIFQFNRVVHVRRYVDE